MRRIVICALSALGAACANAPSINIQASETDPSASPVSAMARAGKSEVEAFFGAPFAETINLTIAPDRAAFDAAFPASLEVGKTECWMVGLGVADGLYVLSPSAWPKQACDHDATDAAHIQDVVTHELVHVYHGQHNPTRDFTGADDIGWFIEGVAVLASGQLDGNRLAAAAAAVKRNGGPASLDAVWSGRERYGLAGSLVRYVDLTYGRSTLVSLLPLTSQAALLSRVDVSEAQLLAGWKAWLIKQAPE